MLYKAPEKTRVPTKRVISRDQISARRPFVMNHNWCLLVVTLLGPLGPRVGALDPNCGAGACYDPLVNAACVACAPGTYSPGAPCLGVACDCVAAPYRGAGVCAATCAAGYYCPLVSATAGAVGPVQCSAAGTFCPPLSVAPAVR